MRAAVVTRYGPPEVLRIMEAPKPEPGPGEILVETKALGLNYADVFARLGVYPEVPKAPFVPGIEAAGVVRGVGSGVRRLRRGTRVLAFTQHRGYAEFVCVPESFAVPIPPRMPFRDAAAFGVASLTAYHGLVTLGHLQRGERVLIHAAAGGVGLAAVQIANHLRAEVFGTVGSNEKMLVASRHGAQHVFNYRTASFADWIRRETAGEGVDVILDSIGGRVSREGLKILSKMGRLVIFGFAAVSGPRGINKVKAIREILATPRIYIEGMVNKNIGILGFNLFFLGDKVRYLQAAMKTLLGWYQRGILRPVIGASYDFDKIAEAHVFLQTRKSAGKVIVEMDSANRRQDRP